MGAMVEAKAQKVDDKLSFSTCQNFIGSQLGSSGRHSAPCSALISSLRSLYGRPATDLSECHPSCQSFLDVVNCEVLYVS